MKKIQTLAMVMGLMVATANVAPAQGIGISTGGDEAGISMDAGGKKKKKKKSSKKKATASKVGKAVGKLKTFNGKPSKKALVYVYLQSASWCGPCNQEMPEVASVYQEMAKDGRAELVLIGCDQTEDGAKKFLKQYKAKFPGVLSTAKNVDKLPGFTAAQGIPNAIMVDAEGNVLANGFPSAVLSQWKQKVEELEAAAAEGDADNEE